VSDARRFQDACAEAEPSRPARGNNERTRKPVGIVFDEHTDEDGQCVPARLQDGLEGILSKRLTAR
jgi:hypothetical protein